MFRVHFQFLRVGFVLFCFFASFCLIEIGFLSHCCGLRCCRRKRNVIRPSSHSTRRVCWCVTAWGCFGSVLLNVILGHHPSIPCFTSMASLKIRAKQFLDDIKHFPSIYIYVFWLEYIALCAGLHFFLVTETNKVSSRCFNHVGKIWSKHGALFMSSTFHCICRLFWLWRGNISNQWSLVALTHRAACWTCWRIVCHLNFHFSSDSLLRSISFTLYWLSC